MGEHNSKEILTGITEQYRSQVRLLDLVLDLERDVKDLKKRLKELEGRKCGGCHHD